MVKVIPISKEYRANYDRIEGFRKETVTESGEFTPYFAVGCLGYPGWFVEDGTCKLVDESRV